MMISLYVMYETDSLLGLQYRSFYVFSAGVAAGGEKMALPRDSTRDTSRIQDGSPAAGR